MENPIQDYFTWVSQIKEKLEAVGDKLDEDELVMTALNGLTRPWDSFTSTATTSMHTTTYCLYHC